MTNILPHVKTHLESRVQYTCFECDEPIRKGTEFTEIKIDEKTIQLHEPQCALITLESTRAFLTAKIFQVGTTNKFDTIPCPFCEAPFVKAFELLKHLEKTHKEKKHK